MYFNAKKCGIRIKALREHNEMTQEQLANQLNVSCSHLGKIEIGNRVPSIDLLIDLSNYFGVSLDYIILGKVTCDHSAEIIVSDVIKQLSELKSGFESKTTITNCDGTITLTP